MHDITVHRIGAVSTRVMYQIPEIVIILISVAVPVHERVGVAFHVLSLHSHCDIVDGHVRDRVVIGLAQDLRAYRRSERYGKLPLGCLLDVVLAVRPPSFRAVLIGEMSGRGRILHHLGLVA